MIARYYNGDVGMRLLLLNNLTKQMHRFKLSRINNMIIPELSLRDIIPQFEEASFDFQALVQEIGQNRREIGKIAKEISEFNTDFSKLYTDLADASVRYMRLFNLSLRIDEKRSFPIQKLDEVPIRVRKEPRMVGAESFRAKKLRTRLYNKAKAIQSAMNLEPTDFLKAKQYEKRLGQIEKSQTIKDRNWSTMKSKIARNQTGKLQATGPARSPSVPIAKTKVAPAPASASNEITKIMPAQEDDKSV